jgi:hypothetical protein
MKAHRKWEEFIQLRHATISDRFAGWTTTVVLHDSRADNAFVVVAIVHRKSHLPQNVRHEALPRVLALSNQSGIVVKETMASTLDNKEVKDESLTSSIMSFARSRVLLPSVRQPRRSPPHKLAREWVAHLQGRIHQCAQVLMTSLPRLHRRCL